MIEIRPIVQAVGPDNPSKQISVNNWNLGHALTASPNVLIGTDGAGAEKEVLIGVPGGIPSWEDLVTGLDGKVSVSGDVMTGTLEVSNAVTVKAPGGVNGNYWLVNESGTRQGVFYWDRASDTVRLRAQMPDGVTLASEIILSPTEFTFQLGALQPLVVDAAGATVTGVLTTTGRIDAGGIITTGGANAGMYLNDRDGTGQIVLYDNGDVFRVYINGADRFTVNATGGGTFQGPVTLPTEAYGPSWNGKSEAPTKDALYDKIESLAAPTILWGNITGTLSNQTDLQNALNAKVDDTELALYATDMEVSALLTNYVPLTQKGAAGGVVPLNGSIKIDATYLPSYVDDVLEYANLAAFPVTGETGKIYVAIDTGKTYRWTGSAYTEISSTVPVTSIVGITGTKAEFNTALTDDNFAYLGTANAFTANQTISLASPALTLNPVSGTSTIDLRGTASTNDGLSLRASGSTATFAADTTLWRNRAASVTFGTLNSTNLTMTVPIVVPDVAYAPAWDGDFSVPTKNAVYDKINSMGAGGAVDDTAYGGSWDGVTTIAPSKNAVWDKIEALSVGGGGVTTFNTRSGAVTLTGADVSAAGASANFSVTNTGADAYATVNGGSNAAYVQLLRSGGAAQIKLTTLNDIEFNNGVGAITINGETNVDFQINDLSKLNIATAKVVSTVPVEVPDVAYAVGWNGSVAVPTRNAVYDKIEAVIATIPAATTSIVGITGTLAQFNTAITDADIMPTAGGTFTGRVLIDTETNGLAGGLASALIYGDNNTERLELQSAGTGDPTFQAKSASGTYALPGATPIDRTLFQLGASGHDGATWVTSNRAIIRAKASEGWTGSAQGAYWTFLTTAPGAIAAVERVVINETGLAVTGNITATGTITSSGAPLATVSQLANYLPLTGGTVTGLLACSSGFVCTNGNIVSQAAAGGNAQYDLKDDLNVRQGLIFWNRGDDTIKIRRYDAAGTAIEGELTIGATTATFTNTTLWLNTDKMYMLHNGTNGYIRTAPSVGGDLYLGAQGASTLQLIAGGAAAFTGSVAISTTLAVTGTSAFNGNITLSRNYPNIFIDSTATDGSGNERSAIQFRNHETNGWLIYSKGEMAAPEFVWRAIVAGATPGSEVVRFTTTGDIICTGAIYAASNKRAYQQATAMAGAEIYMSTSAPSGGADGDIWLQYV